MGATRRLFVYKCELGHVSEHTFSLGTRLEDYDEIICSECDVKSDALAPAYLVEIRVVSAKGDGTVGRRT
jgi:hypothetical protein